MCIYQNTRSALIGLIFQILIVHLHAECGLVDPHNNQNSILPWTVNIYYQNENNDYSFICSGTIISPKVIITAARCFYDEAAHNIKNYTYVLTVGQKSKDWNSSNEHKILSNNILIANQYKGKKNNYAYNIALIKLDSNQKLNANMKMACVYWDNDFVESTLETNLIPLKVISWLNTNNAFIVVSPTYVDYDVCQNSVSNTFRPFVTFDKMCGQLDGSHAISSLGGGLFALNRAKSRWYLIGVACETTISDSKTFMTFMKLQSHLNWISNNAFLDV
ncbi:hypothetical protein ILUMI_21887 [Ignelater luminosus]|uniref:Peptidase S1 domain-containing protein n=1 Tax=Ignelater luminosus TaxID=2038154 RepID=A0A8K0FXN6_IGNLU|nr:hypothetical protein ILUMI_21887 [Ignelater luminosus]